jgi:serine protease AprX
MTKSVAAAQQNHDAMNRTAKIYCTRKELARFAPSASLIESYDAFQLVEITSAALKKATAVVPVEDVTDLYRIDAGGRRIDTRKPRYNKKGKLQSHPSYKNVAKLQKGPHHYLVQFIGPIKQAWISAVKKAGGIARGPFGDFSYIFKLDAKALAAVSGLRVVRWVGHLPHASRVSAGVFLGKQDQARRPERSGPFDLGGRDKILPEILTLQFFDPKELPRAIPAVRRTGAEIVSEESKAGVIVAKVPAKTKQRREIVKALSAVHGVRLITPKAVRSIRNNVAAKFMGTQTSSPLRPTAWV